MEGAGRVCWLGVRSHRRSDLKRTEEDGSTLLVVVVEHARVGLVSDLLTSNLHLLDGMMARLSKNRKYFSDAVVHVPKHRLAEEAEEVRRVDNGLAAAAVG